MPAAAWISSRAFGKCGKLGHSQFQIQDIHARIKTVPPAVGRTRAVSASDAITTPLYLPDHAQPETGCSSAWPEHCVRDAGVAGSNPVTPIFFSER